MGNNGSRTGHISHQLEAETTWTQSFPRSTHGVYHQHKVLPEKGITKKLRSTNNGEILHAGGTISGRQHHQKTLSLERENKSFKIFRTSSVSSNPSDDPREYGERPYPRYVSHYGGVNRYAAQRLENRNLYREQMKKYGSEPDLRNSPSDRNESGRYKGKKKYKAPAPPNHGPVRPDPDGAVSSAASSPMMPFEKKINLRAEEYPERSHRQRVPSELSDENVKKTQMTLILSEYRQPQREYKDFRGSPRYMAEFGDAHHPKQTTIHPQVTCNMPKASNTQPEGSSNYRKQFAHGVKTNRSGDSTYSDDSQPVNRNSSPKIYRSERTPISRF
uniref:Uncharacterized protein n=1 Tax=Photinus pyralis TaxID=7054 RepID=A0A1Y1LQH1_PHOPY